MKTKTYYEQIEKSVLPQLKSYQTDITEHDKKQLDNYKGKFLYAFRDTGTNLFRIDTFFEHLNILLETGKNEYFTERGIYNILSGEYHFINSHLNLLAIYPKTKHNHHFILGEKGKIKTISADQMTVIIESYKTKFDDIAKQIKNKYNHQRIAS